MYSKYKLLLLVIIVLHHLVDKDNQELGKINAYMVNDLKVCATCFTNQSDLCQRIQKDYEFDEEFTNTLNFLFGIRPTSVLREISNKSNRIYAKYLARDFDFNFITHDISKKETIDILSQSFFNESRLDGMQFCPKSGIERFVNFFATNHSRLSIWLHMNVDFQPIMLPHLHSIGFPVPKTYANCGFTTFQSAEGVSLANLYSSDFKVKLKIAAQLLEGALKFSEGFDNFRVYITDMNMDNVVYDLLEEKLSYVDLDTVLIVDGTKYPNSVHGHEYLECDDCFAFSPNDICSHGKSDLNLFSVCQLLREDLRKDRSRGFLYPIPDSHTQLKSLLNECVDCPKEICKNRFQVAVNLVEHFKDVIKNSLSF